jgi:hypothetical protein
MSANTPSAIRKATARPSKEKKKRRTQKRKKKERKEKARGSVWPQRFVTRGHSVTHVCFLEILKGKTVDF